MRVQRWASAWIGAALLLAGCDVGDRVAHQTSGTTTSHPCLISDGVRVVPDYVDQATGTTVIAWTVLSRYRCALDRHPTVTVYDTNHRVLPFRVRERSSVGTTYLMVDAKHPAALELQKYRCDVGPATFSRTARIAFPHGFAATVNAELHHCTDSRDSNDLTISIGA